jgi:hypothetical protein
MSTEQIAQISTCLGLIIIIIFSVGDFIKKLRKSKSLWRYYFAMIVFLAVNITVYLVLTLVALQQSPLTLLIGNVRVTGSYVNAVLPLVIAVIYFGAGAGSFRLGNKEIQLHNKLLETLQGMFNTRLIKTEDVTYEVSDSQSLYEKLRDKAEGIQISASANQWDVLQAKWDDYVDDEELLNKQVTYLDNLKDKLEVIKGRLDIDSATFKEIMEVIRNVRKRIDTIRKILAKKLRKYLVAFAFANFRDDKTLEKFLIDIEVLQPGEEQAPTSRILTRGLVMGFIFGLLFGPIFGAIKHKDELVYSWVGAFCLMIFTGFISKAVTTSNFIKSVILGAVGGYIAHLAWILASHDKYISFSAGMLPQINWDADLLMKPGVGLFFGIVTSLLLFAFKYKVPQKFTTSYKGYILVALSGLIFYPSLYILLSIGKFNQITVLLVACVGVVVMSAMSLATNVVRPVPKSDL